MDIKEKKATNTWENKFNLKTLLAFIEKAANYKQYVKPDSWKWIRNPRCKYINIRIDMRDGGFVLLDRGNKRISFDELKYQYKLGDENGKD